ncbi:hypothetical protein GCM10017556_31690 [Micromonospora sagamiensis]|nr:hypothetical protein GCM10017556_31690 [Micromonospora sagamiensis]
MSSSGEGGTTSVTNWYNYGPTIPNPVDARSFRTGQTLPYESRHQPPLPSLPWPGARQA